MDRNLVSYTFTFSNCYFDGKSPCLFASYERISLFVGFFFEIKVTRSWKSILPQGLILCAPLLEESRV